MTKTLDMDVEAFQSCDIAQTLNLKNPALTPYMSQRHFVNAKLPTQNNKQKAPSLACVKATVPSCIIRNDYLNMFQLSIGL